MTGSRALQGAVLGALTLALALPAAAQVDAEAGAAIARIDVACASGPSGQTTDPVGCVEAIAQALLEFCAPAAVAGPDLRPVPRDPPACLLIIERATEVASALPTGQQAQIGVRIGDIAETLVGLRDEIFGLVEDANLAALSTGVTVGFQDEGPTEPKSASPA